MTINVEVVKHSVTQGGKEIITAALTYHRYIHGEVMTHRVLSRNAMSSRAMPVAKMLKQVWSNPATPVHWGANQPGMQARAELQGWRRAAAKALWKWSSMSACFFSWAMNKVGLAKQVANRPLEPYQWMVALVTATEWDNFFELRDHPDAQPEFQVLAKDMRKAFTASKPQVLLPGQWHLPFIYDREQQHYGVMAACSISAARCARVSYLNHDGTNPSPMKDLALFDRLVGSKPLHASPVEHQATPGDKDTGNFVGWTQYRKLLERDVTFGKSVRHAV